MRRLLLLVSLSCIASASLAAPPGLLVTPDGYYVVTIGPDGKPVQEKITQVMVLGTAPTPPPGGGTPVPPTDSVADRIATITTSELPDAGEATALAVALNAVSKRATSDADVEILMNTAVSVVGGSLNAKTRVDKWYAAVKAAPGFALTRSGLSSAIAGIVKAHSLDPTILKTVTNAAVEGFEDGKTTEQVAQGLHAVYPNAAFDFTQIISLIMAILQLLKDLGILG